MWWELHFDTGVHYHNVGLIISAGQHANSCYLGHKEQYLWLKGGKLILITTNTMMHDDHIKVIPVIVIYPEMHVNIWKLHQSYCVQSKRHLHEKCWHWQHKVKKKKNILFGCGLLALRKPLVTGKYCDLHPGMWVKHMLNVPSFVTHGISA